MRSQSLSYTLKIGHIGISGEPIITVTCFLNLVCVYSSNHHIYLPVIENEKLVNIYENILMRPDK